MTVQLTIVPTSVPTSYSAPRALATNGVDLDAQHALRKMVVAYYDATYLHYRALWLDRENRAMHFGFTDEKTQGHSAALNNMNRILSERVGLRTGEVVLDAGCGVGGSAIWLAKNIGATVIGLSLSRRQIERATRYAREQSLAQRVKFLVGDFTATGFANDTFDVVWAIESVCYMLNKADFVREAHRILKRGGRLVVADGFRCAQVLAPPDEALLNSWLMAWAIPNLATPEAFLSDLREIGFDPLNFENVTQHVLASSLRLYCLSLIAYPLARILGEFGYSALEVANVRGARDQFRSLARGQWLYGIVTAAKRGDTNIL